MGHLGASVAERKLAWKLGDGGGQRRAGFCWVHRGRQLANLRQLWRVAAGEDETYSGQGKRGLCHWAAGEGGWKMFEPSKGGRV